MGDYFFEICDKTIQLKNKKKHLNIKSNLFLTESINNKYSVRNPELDKIEEILKKTC